MARFVGTFAYRQDSPAPCCTELKVYKCTKEHSHIGCRHQKYVSEEWVKKVCLDLRNSCVVREEHKIENWLNLVEIEREAVIDFSELKTSEEQDKWVEANTTSRLLAKVYRQEKRRARS